MTPSELEWLRREGAEFQAEYAAIRAERQVVIGGELLRSSVRRARDGVELALKQLTHDIAKYKGAGEGPTLEHLIAALWRQLKPDLDEWIESRRYGGEGPPESTEFDDIMADLVCVEPTGFPSRYPTTKAGADIHPQLSTVDFAKFVHAVRRSESTQRTWMHQLSEDASFQADYRTERRRTRDDRHGD